MPLLICPNCDTATQAVRRSGVEFDLCPQCRGIWLDRGELEKLMSAARDEVTPVPAQPRLPDYERHAAAATATMTTAPARSASTCSTSSIEGEPATLRQSAARFRRRS